MLTNRLARIIGVVVVACSVLVAVPASNASARIEPGGDIFTLQEGGLNRQVQIGYNPDKDEYLATWHTDTSSSPNTSVFASILDADGKPTGQPVLLAKNPDTGATGLLTSADRWRSDVSYNTVTKQYLVTIMRNMSGGRNSTILGVLVSDTGAKASGELVISDALGASTACLAEYPDAVADPTTGGYKLVYSRTQNSNIGGCEGLAPDSEFLAAVVIQSLSGDLTRGPRVDVPVRSIYPMSPLIAYNPVTKNFLVAHSTHDGVFATPKGHANIYDSALNKLGPTTDLARGPGDRDDGGSYAFPIADPVSGNWVVLYVGPGIQATQMTVLNQTGAKISDAAITFRGTISALSAIGDGTVLASNYQGPVQQLRQDGTEIHFVAAPLAAGNSGIPSIFVANGKPGDARAAGIGFHPTTSATASRGMRVFASGPLPLSPARLLDTRDGSGFTTIDGTFQGGGKKAAGSIVQLKVAGRGGVPADAEAVLLNIAAAGTSAVGFVTAYPCDAPRPTTSNLNYPAGGAASAAAIAKVSATGLVCLYTSGEAHLIVDVNGNVPQGGSVSPLVPARLLESRTGPEAKTTDGLFQGIGRVAAGSTTPLKVTGRGGIDATADAVLVNVTAINPTDRAFLTVFPCDATRPTAASLNAPAGGNVNNLVTAKVSATGTICVFSNTATDLVVDASAFVPDNGGLLSIVPAGLFESRTGSGNVTIDGESQGSGRVEAGSTTQIRVTRGDVPEGATGVMLNVAAITPDTEGFMTAYPWPCDASNARPTAANVNFAAGAVVSNAVFVKVGDPVPSGFICVYSSAATDLAVDVVAYTVDS